MSTESLFEVRLYTKIKIVFRACDNLVMKLYSYD